MHIRKVKSNNELNDFLLLYALNNRLEFSEAYDKINKTKNHEYFVIYEGTLRTKKIGYLLIEDKDYIKEIFVNKHFRKTNITIKILWNFFESFSRGESWTWHYNHKQSLGIIMKMSQNPKTQKMRIKGEKYEIPIWKFYKSGVNTDIRKLSKKEILNYITKP